MSYFFCTSTVLKPNRAVQELRGRVGPTQGEFAAMIGASKDTAVSWENGRNKLSDGNHAAVAAGIFHAGESSR